MNVMEDAFAKPGKTLRRLELFQILGVISDNAAMIRKCLKDTPDVSLTVKKLGIILNFWIKVLILSDIYVLLSII